MSHLKIKTSNRDINSALAKAASSGWVIRKTNSNHLKVISPGGSIVWVGSTPSDWRAVQNTVAKIRRIERKEQQL